VPGIDNYFVSSDITSKAAKKTGNKGLTLRDRCRVKRTEYMSPELILGSKDKQ